ncbi:MAG: Stk1 family PASTA domain-containing Ser/Thr kinase [Pseudonocardia sp.]|nr:Stk1 family PASTA domain-containing Ser/Thr kinase [Pseudonocardia sp.]
MTTPRLLSERYELGETIGYGGMSEVHRGLDTRLGRDVAIKVLRADLARDPQFQMRFRREAQNAASLNHPAIVSVYDTGETQSESGPLPYIVMEYVDGQTLREIIRSTGPMSQQRVIEVMADVCAALDFSHRHQIIHRDVKPANVMINRAGAVKVMDFGIARALGEGQNVTQTAAVIGTAQYLSPEQARGEAVDARSDVYAAGCVLFELLTGEPPFTGDTPVAVAYQHVREDPRRPSEVNPNIPPELEAVALKALSKNPVNRYQSAAEMRADLVRVRSGQAPMAPAVLSEDERTAMLAPPAPGGPTRRIGSGRFGSTAPAPAYYDEYDDEPRRSTGRTVGIAALIAVALGIVGFVAYQLLSGPPPTEKVTIPATLIGQTQQAATNALIGAKLQVTTQEVESLPAEKGNVVRTNPAPGTEVAVRSTVTLFIGKGPASVSVPPLAGKTVTEAAAALKERGLQLGDQIPTETEDPTLLNKVIGSSPAAGEEVPGDSSVDVQVGVQPTGEPLEDYAGRSVEDVEEDLRSKGYNPQRADGVEGDDTVTGTSPPAGQRVPDGSTVTILSNGNNGTKQVPSVRGLTEEDAKGKLGNAGFKKVRTQVRQVDNPLLDGRVLAQSPEAGQTADTGEQVTIVIGKFSTGNGN